MNLQKYNPLFYEKSLTIKTLLVPANGLILKFNCSKLAFFISLLILTFSGLNNCCYAQKLTGVTPYDTSLAKVHSARKASFYSAVLPGLGQVYNRKYWKVPIIYGGFMILFYAIDFNNTYYTKFKKAYIYRTDGDPNTSAEFNYFGVNTKNLNNENQLLEVMDFHKRNRDLCILGLAGFYILNIIDATVDAYLFDYDVTQNLSLHLEPGIINTQKSYGIGLTCSLRF